MPEKQAIRVNWGILPETQVKIDQIKQLLKYRNDGNVVDYAVDRLHAALFSEPNAVVTVAEAIRVNQAVG